MGGFVTKNQRVIGLVDLNHGTFKESKIDTVLVSLQSTIDKMKLKLKVLSLLNKIVSSAKQTYHSNELSKLNQQTASESYISQKKIILKSSFNFNL